GCDGLLVVEPENFAWLTSGAAARGVLDPGEAPALYFTADQRWVVTSNVDSQRLFDEELNGLGFQLKEWPWHWGREQLLADLCHNRKIASDRPLNDQKLVREELRGLRRVLTPYEQACMQVLGPLVSHALEATCRTMSPEIIEREVAAQLSHRLLHRGAQPVCVEVAADGRSRRYRQCGFTSLPVRRYCVMTLTARKYGLYATSSRAVCFGEPDPIFKKEHDAACKVSATYIASTWPDALPRQIFTAGQHTYRLTGFEHEWRLCPQGHITGRLPVEMSLLPNTESLFRANWAITWHASVGAAFSSDTFLISEEGPKLVTPPEMWPLKRIRVQGADFFRPDLLLR
ncbi:MAG TPA: M24 family metallopeptidase, partial [Gemmataceae bacterium]|nr:M24 family metallopeptidase [Gemmataceae bacterium]